LTRGGLGDTKDVLIRLLKWAITEVPWPELPGGTKKMFEVQMDALDIIAECGEPEAAVEILSRHVEDVERYVSGPSRLAMYCIYRLAWLLGAAWKVKDRGKKSAYVAEAKGLMERAMRSLRDLQDWDQNVRSLSLRHLCCAGS
jgi:hypothetical protein